MARMARDAPPIVIQIAARRVATCVQSPTKARPDEAEHRRGDLDAGSRE